MMRLAWCLLAVGFGVPAVLAAQDSVARRYDVMQDVQRATGRRAPVHYGKWLTAGSAVAFTVLAANEHRASRRYWNQLLDLCRSADTACTVGANGAYLLAPAESLYQRSVYYDRRASYRLLGAQASVVVTVALFILDRRPGDGPDNIPFSPVRLTAEPLGDGARVGLRIAF